MMLLTQLVLAGVTITLPMEARVRGTEMTLGDVATVTGANADEVALARALDLGYAPAPGYSRLLSAEKIAEVAARKLPEVALTFAGDRHCRVWPEVQEIAEADVRLAAQTELVRLYGVRDAAFELVAPIPAIVVPSGSGSPSIRARLDQRAEQSGLVTVPVEVIVDEATYRTVFTTWRVDVYSVVPVLAKNVRAGESLSAALFERRRIRIDAAAQAGLLGIDRLHGSVAKRDLAAGSLVTGLDVDRPAIVALGTSLSLQVKKGGIAARVGVIALESGALGDRIRVRREDSKQELHAVIKSRDQVEIDLGP